MSTSGSASRATQVDIDYTQVEATNFDGDNGSDPANPEGFPSLVIMNDGQTYAYTVHARNNVPAGGGSQWSFLLTNNSPELTLTIDEVNLYYSTENSPWRGNVHFGERLVAGTTDDGFPRDMLGRLGFTVSANGGRLRHSRRYTFPDGWLWEPHDDMGVALFNGNGSASTDDCVHELTFFGRVGPETARGTL